MQSGVSALIRSRMTDLAMAWPAFAMSSLRMAYSVLVSRTGVPSTVRAWAAVSSRRPPTVSTLERGWAAWTRSWAAIRASSSRGSKGLVT